MLTSIGLIKSYPAGKIATVGQKRFLILGNCRDEYNHPSIITAHDKDGRDYYVAQLHQVIKFLDIIPDVRKIVDRGDVPYFFIIPHSKISDVRDKKEISKIYLCAKCGKVISSRQRDNNNTYVQLCSDCLKANYRLINSYWHKRSGTVAIYQSDCLAYYLPKKDYIANISKYEKCSICKNIYEKRAPRHSCSYPVQSYGLKFSKEVIKKLSPNVRYFGIEHEICTNESEELSREIRAKYQDLFLTKQDGSIEGIELVSRPLTYEFLESFNWNEYMTICNRYGEESDTTGMHIHVSKNQISRGDAVLILKFFAYNYNSILKFTKRDEESLNNWAYIGDGYENPKRLFNSQYNKATWHGCALNTSNPNTDEFRIFASTLSQRQFKANYQFVNALIDYVKQLKSLDLSFKSFCAYVNKLQGHSQLKYVIERSI